MTLAVIETVSARLGPIAEEHDLVEELDVVLTVMPVVVNAKLVDLVTG